MASQTDVGGVWEAFDARLKRANVGRVEAQPQPSRQDTIDAILEASDRPTATVPIRHSFVQRRDEQRKPIPGPLAALVGRGRDSTVEQYLLLRAWASGGNFDVKRDARVWARALALSSDEAGRRTVGRNWKILRELKLVTTERSGREIRVTVLRDDGSGEPYRHPGEAPRESYAQLDYRYWRDGHHLRLSVPGKAALLIALTLGDWFALPTRRGPNWYGLSRSTLERGFADARKHGVLEAQKHLKLAPLAPDGYTLENYYRLLPPFGPSGHLAKSANVIFSPDAKRSTPPSQADSPRGTAKRRRPASHGVAGEPRSPGARQTSRPRHRPTKA